MSGKTHTPIYDLGTIKKVPVQIWSGELDVTCSNWEARNTKEIIGERVTHFHTVRGANHGFWGGKELTDGLFKEFSEQLIHPERKSYSVTVDPLFTQN